MLRLYSSARLISEASGIEVASLTGVDSWYMSKRVTH